MASNVPGYNPAFDSIYNASGFDGQVTSDFLRIGGIPYNSKTPSASQLGLMLLAFNEEWDKKKK